MSWYASSFTCNPHLLWLQSIQVTFHPHLLTSMTTQDWMRIALLVVELGMLLLALFYLRRRQLHPLQRLLWVLLALVIPLLGSFLVIALHPGQPEKRGGSST
jgi:hypothetical protein